MTERGGLSLGGVTRLSAALRKCGYGAGSMEAASERIAQLLFDTFENANGERAVALARVYRTMRFERLEPELQEAASQGDPVTPETPCLALLASRGVEPNWNDRRRSVGHRAIPLRSRAAVERLPMIAGLLDQFDAASLVDGNVREVAERRAFNVFHVGEATGSPLVPAQDFVRDYRIKSVVGFGGFLPPTDLFAAILFFTEPISSAQAELFGPLGLSVKLSLLEVEAEGRVFA